MKAAGPALVVDAGDLMWKSKTLDASRIAQQRVKGRLQLEAMSQGGIDAMVLGDADLTLGLEWIGQQMRDLDLPYVATNMVCEGVPMPAYRRVSVGDLEVGVLGVMGREQAGACTFKAVVPAISQALDGLGEVDLVVVLSHQDSGAERDMAAAVPEIDVIINGHSKKSTPTPISLGETAVQLGAGSRGKKLGVATLQIEKGARGFQVDGRLKDLERKLDRAAERLAKTQDQLKRAKDDKTVTRLEGRLRRIERQAAEARSALSDAADASAGPRHRIANTLRPLSEKVADDETIEAMVQASKPMISAAAQLVAPSGTQAVNTGPFAGSAACEGCHADEHKQWKTTPHASAWSTLVRQGRERDLDCWSCHVTGAHHPLGPQHPSQVSGLEDVGCESCHGPGQSHVAAPSKGNIRRDPAVEVCTDCHDGVKDEGRFDFAKYRPQVLH